MRGIEKIDWQYYANKVIEERKKSSKEIRKERRECFEKYCNENLTKILHLVKKDGYYFETIRHPWQKLFLRKIAIDYNIGIKQMIDDTKEMYPYPTYCIELYNKYLCED